MKKLHRYQINETHLYIALATGNLLRKKCYNVTVTVTMFKYLRFSAGKTVHLDRLSLENSLKKSRAYVGRLFVCLL